MRTGSESATRQTWVANNTAGRCAKLIGLSWLSMLGFDFFLHAGVLARWYVDPSPFLLAPQEAFVRIPFGYLSFLLLAVFLVWMLDRLKVEDWRRGGMLGLMVGGFIWGAFAVGLFSISTAPVALLIGWFIGQTIELGIAGVVIGAGISGHHLGKLFAKTMVFVVVAVLVTIVLQVLGLAPAIQAG